MPYESRQAFFSIVDSDGTSTRDLSAHLTGISGLPGERELVDVTRLGDSGHRFVASLFNGRFELEGLYDKTASTGVEVVLTNILHMSSATTFVYGPTGNSSGQSPVNRRITGSGWIRSLDEPARVGAAVSFRASGQVDGVTSYGTFT